MPRKKPKVPAAYADPAGDAARTVAAALNDLLMQDADADWRFHTAGYAWSVQNDRVFWQCVEWLAHRLYWPDPTVRRLINLGPLAQFIANAAMVSAQPEDDHSGVAGAAAAVAPMSLLRLRPDDAISVTVVNGKTLTEGFDEASDAEVQRARKDLEISKAIRQGAKMPGAGGRPDGGEYPDEPTFRLKVEPVVRELRTAPGGATLQSAAEKLDRHPRDLSRLCKKRTRLDWPAFVASVT